MSTWPSRRTPALHSRRPAASATAATEWDPTILVDVHGILHLSYTYRYSGLHTAIHYRRSADYGVTWSSAEELSEPSAFFSWWGYDSNRDILWALWKDERDRDGGDRKSDLMVSFSRNHGVSWSQAQFATDLGDLDNRFPAIAADPNGHPYVIWTDLRDGDSNASIFVRRWSLPATAGVRSLR